MYHEVIVDESAVGILSVTDETVKQTALPLVAELLAVDVAALRVWPTFGAAIAEDDTTRLGPGVFFYRYNIPATKR